MTHTFATESDLVAAFARGVAEHGLQMPDGTRRDAFIVGHEVALLGASTLGNMGAADLLAVTADGRWWLIEAKLARNAESAPSFLFGNQLARYAKAIETIGVAKLHGHLSRYLYGRSKALMPPVHLCLALERVRDLEAALGVWCDSRGMANSQAEARRLCTSLAEQIERRTLTLAALLDTTSSSHARWVKEQAGIRSLAVLGVERGCPHVAHAALAELTTKPPSIALLLPPFDEIPQSYKPSPRTLPRVLSESAYQLYEEVLASRLLRWMPVEWPDVRYLDAPTSGAFGLHLRSPRGRELCLQIGRSDMDGPDRAGRHPLKLLFNFIWGAETVFDVWMSDRDRGEDEYRALETLVTRLCTAAGTEVRGARGHPPGSTAWRRQIDAKMRGSTEWRAELVVVRLRGQRDGYCVNETPEEIARDRAMLMAALDAVEAWMGEGQYRSIPKRSTRPVKGIAVATRSR